MEGSVDVRLSVQAVCVDVVEPNLLIVQRIGKPKGLFGSGGHCHQLLAPGWPHQDPHDTGVWT